MKKILMMGFVLVTSISWAQKAKPSFLYGYLGFDAAGTTFGIDYERKEGVISGLGGYYYTSSSYDVLAAYLRPHFVRSGYDLSITMGGSIFSFKYPDGAVSSTYGPIIGFALLKDFSRDISVGISSYHHMIWVGSEQGFYVPIGFATLRYRM